MTVCFIRDATLEDAAALTVLINRIILIGGTTAHLSTLMLSGCRIFISNQHWAYLALLLRVKVILLGFNLLNGPILNALGRIALVQTGL